MNRKPEIDRSVLAQIGKPLKLSKPVINQSGFTIVEIIAVLLILGVLAAVAIPRYINLHANATENAIDYVIAELNGRENLTWAEVKISAAGYTDDATLQDKVNYNLGSDYRWIDPPMETGGTVEFRGMTYTINRSRSTDTQQGIWSQ